MKKIFKNKWFKRIIVFILVAALATGGVFVWKNKNAAEPADSQIATAIVTRRSITNTVTGSGTVEAYETYNIVPTVTGDIVFCNVEEGDWVEEDQTLYKFDTEKSDNAISKAQNSVENAKLSLESAQDNVADLTVKAPMQGVVSGMSVMLGEKVNGTLCTITDNTYMIAQIPVAAALVDSIKKGDKVTVSLEKYMTTVEGYVDRKTTATQAGENGSVVTIVDVRVDNPGAIGVGTMAHATFHTADGDIDSAQAASLNYSDSAKATAEQSGTISTLNVKNGDWVNKGDIIAVLENTSVTNQLKTAQRNYNDAVSDLADTKKAAEDYILTAPISGKILQKNYKKGDTVAGNNSTTLMVVADTTKMKFTINVDELDVAKISVGQEVTIEADAIEGEVFIGRIETVSMLGTASNGVTYYPVEVVIDEPGELIPGMNVSAEIIVESAENVIAVPSGAVSYYDGAYYVTVAGEVEGMADMPQRGSMPQGEMPTGDMPQRGEMPQGKGGRSKGEEMEIKKNMYDEPLRVQVTTGVSDDDYIEIVTGDIKVGYIVQVTDSDNSSSGWGMMGGMPMGGMGGRPSGMGGGMPMGGMR